MAYDDFNASKALIQPFSPSVVVSIEHKLAEKSLANLAIEYGQQLEQSLSAGARSEAFNWQAKMYSAIKLRRSLTFGEGAQS